jgi:hypothetical protein
METPIFSWRAVPKIQTHRRFYGLDLHEMCAVYAVLPRPRFSGDPDSRKAQWCE